MNKLTAWAGLGTMQLERSYNGYLIQSLPTSSDFATLGSRLEDKDMLCCVAVSDSTWRVAGIGKCDGFR
jgi:hypothetical protein